MVTVLRPRDKIAKKNSAFILGEQAKHDNLRNCVTCTRWTFCQDPAKSFRYRCTRYQENSIDDTSIDNHKSLGSLFGIDADGLVEMKKTKKDDLNIREDPEEDARLDEVIAEALSANSPIPPDIKIKDAEIPHAANFYEWLIDERFTGGGESPFPRQIWVGGLLFAEFCVAEGTRIQTNKGLVKIEEICNDLGQNEVFNWKAISRQGKQKITHAGKTNRRKVSCLRIESLGRNFLVTPNHRILINRTGWSLEWVEARNLKIGDNIVAPYTEGMWAKSWPVLPSKQEFHRIRELNRSAELKWPKRVNVDICSAIGYLLGDGSIGKYSIRLINTFNEISKHFKKCMQSICDMSPRIDVISSKITKNVKYYTDDYNSVELADWFNLVGIKSGIHWQKEIPDFIFKCPKEGVIAFLKALLETDGCVTKRNVRLAMTSEKIVIDFALLMQNLGIFGSTRVKKSTKNRTVYWWTCSDKHNVDKLHNLFGKFHSIRGSSDLKEEPAFTSLRLQTKPEVVKNSKFISLYSKERINYHTAKFPLTQFRHNSAHFKDIETAIINLEKFNHLVEHTMGAREIFSNKYSLCAISAIEYAGEHYVYDLTVPVSESFTANGFIVHNCPRCSDMDWLERMKVDATLSKLESKATFLNRGVCPSCKVDRGELVEEGEIANPLELVLICGQRSAKTSSVNLMDSYNIHRYLKLANPSKVYKQLAQQVFTVTYTSSTFGQVRANMWEPFLNIANGSAWFSNYHKFLNRRGHELGEELYNVADIYIRYRHRNLFLSPATPSGQTMRGRTRLSAAIDEISHMPLQRADGKDAARGNAKDTYTALRNSLKTLQIAYKARFREGYFDIPKPLMYDASSPLTINDYGMTLLRMSKVSDEMLGFKYKTWEFNPHLPESEFANDFKTRPIESARDYACEPPIGQSTWLTDIDTISNAFTGKRNMFEVEQFTKRTKSGKKVTAAKLKKVMNYSPEWGCVLAIDIGAVNNSLAFSVSTVPDDFDLEAFVDEESESEDAQVGLVPMKTLFVGEVIPRRDAEVSQNALYKSVFSELCEILPINLIISDRWQNKKMTQDLEEEFGIDYYEYKLRWEDFENLKSALYEKLVTLPRSKADFEKIYSTTLENYPQMFMNKPVDHLIYQFMTVQESRGHSVIKGDATDDMFRCIALSHAALQDKEMLRLLLDVEEEVVNKPHLGVVISARNGTSLNNGMALTPRGASTPRAMAFKSRRS